MRLPRTPQIKRPTANTNCKTDIRTLSQSQKSLLQVSGKEARWRLTFTQIPQPMHSSSLIQADLLVGVASTHSLPAEW